MQATADKIALAGLSDLSRFQKILLITDGTVTKLLEYYVDEEIIVHKLNETLKNSVIAFPEHKQLDIVLPANTLQREICLQGKRSQKNWIYAQSTIFIDQLKTDFRHDLLESNQPIGKLWIKYRLETYKSILTIEEHPAQQLAPYFKIAPSDLIISRTYSVYSNQKIIMIITEKFPRLFFND